MTYVFRLSESPFIFYLVCADHFEVFLTIKARSLRFLVNTSNQSLTTADAEENEYDPVSSLFTPLIMRSTLVSREKDGAMMAYKVTMLKVTFAV